MIEKDPPPDESAEVTNTETRITPQPVAPPPSGSRSDSLSDETVLFSGSNGSARFGRYVIQGVLGAGGFGIVYRALDEQLVRQVAVKVPHAHRMQHESQKSLYLEEARTLASLDHTGVVPIYDYGVLDDGRCYVVSKLIEGSSLSQVIAHSPLSWEVATPLLISIAETLHYVHSCKLIHRDIKPGNLLQDGEGRVYVADFGLAMHETHADSHQAGAGTLNYMSPEQAGGEGHRIDSRSDLFSVGAVMYEMLTGVKPFKGADSQATLENVIKNDPVPISTYQPQVPAELNRICLKLLSKRAADRYQSGQELADDLHYFLSQHTGVTGTSTPRRFSADPSVDDSKIPEVMPRGLRSYESQHAYFFLQLLPGPYDRDGHPESLSHWIRWVRGGVDRPEIHRIGVIAGPSGCGKSSLVKAGLIPLLARQSIATVMVEASIDQTESRLSSALNNRFPELIAEKTLSDKIAAIRRGGGLPAGKELLIVIDQFEQWLHSNHERESLDLIRALRQCDGLRVQCIVLVRDDFWLALNRFMEAVEAPLVVGENVTMVDLFDLTHAQQVLTKFGRAFGRIPKDSSTVSASTREFIRQSIEYVARDGKVFPVHLSLFAEMLKSREWVPETLRELGGAVGMGLQFLRESFSVAHAPPAQRLHEASVRKTLESLLPDVGTEIKTQSRTREQLIEVSGYSQDPKSFDALMKVLESDLKLISPIDTLEKSRSSSEQRFVESRYQLSHDFLVPSIREWLYSEQRKTVRGRCQLLLTEQASNWSKQPVRRNLPLWTDWVMYRTLLSHGTMNDAERRMLQAADKYRGVQSLMGVAILVFGFLGFQYYQSWSAANALARQLATTNFQTATSIIDELSKHSAFTQRAVHQALSQAEAGSDSELRLRLAQVRWEPEATSSLVQMALAGGANEVEAINQVREAISAQGEFATTELWKIVNVGTAKEASEDQKQRAFRGLLLLAKLDPPGSADSRSRWQATAAFLSEWTLKWIPSHPEQFIPLVQGLRPIAGVMTEEFRKPNLLGNQKRNESSRWAALFLKDLIDDPSLRTLIVLDAAPWLWEHLPPTRESISLSVLQSVLADSNAGVPGSPDIAASRIASAATLLMAHSSAFDHWDLLKRSPDPSIRSMMIQRIPLLGVPRQLIEDRFRDETDPGILCSLMSALGCYPGISTEVHESTRQKVRDLYTSAPDAGVHSTCGWLMRQLRIPDEPATLLSVENRSDFQWRMTPEGHLMVRFDARQAPGIGRIFEICAHEVSVSQYLKYRPSKWYNTTHASSSDCPVNVVQWPEAVRYCDYLSRAEGINPDQFFTPPALRDESQDEQLKDFLPSASDYARTGFRLPSSAEWEFACRAGTTSRWFFGSRAELMPKYAVFGELITAEPQVALTYSMPCGLRLPNDAGLFDMFGNVMEWCADVPQGTPGNRIIRGGSHTQVVSELSTTEEDATALGANMNTLGFRVARTIDE